MSNGQDPQGVCCFCNPYPLCGHWCSYTDEFDCEQQGGTWIGGGQLDCDDCEEVCANCDQACTNNSQCPDGYICEFGNCVVDPEANGNPWGGATPCNTPGMAGSKNCPNVLHVKRPFYPDGTPAFNGWGVAIWHPPCDEDCDGDIYDEGELDQDGEFIRKQEDMGPIPFELATDVYDEETNKPIGKYKSGCCCPLYLIVAHCFVGPKCINLSDLCPNEIPEWNPEIGEVLVLRGKEGTNAEGFCGYSLYNFNEDGTQAYGPCNKPIYEWVLNNGCKFGGGSTSFGGCATSLSHAIMAGQGVVNFCDLDVEVFKVPDPSWLEGSHNRLCKYACDRCYGIYEQCGTCECHPEYPECKCIIPIDCDTENTAMKMYFATEHQHLCGPTHPTHDECMFLNEEITSKEYAISDYYWNLPSCQVINTEPINGNAPCQDCEVLLLEKCAEICNCPGDAIEYDCDFPQYAYTYTTPEWVNKSHLRLITTVGGVQRNACYKKVAVVKPENLPEGAQFRSGFINGECHTFEDGHTECHPTNDCSLTNCTFCNGDAPYGQNPIHRGKFDCMSFCPQEDCDDYYGEQGHACWACCINEDNEGNPNCCNWEDGPPGGSPSQPTPEQLPAQLSDWKNIFVFPIKVETEIDIDINLVKTSIPVSFSNGVLMSMVDNPTPQEIETFIKLSPFQYTPDYIKEPLSKIIRTGAVADKRAKVPQVSEANYLGDYSEGMFEWSMWLHIGECLAVNSEQDMTRKCSFDYTVFAYCQTDGCEVDSKILEHKVVQFNLDTNYFGESDET